jgi:hypothetical protein
MSPEIREMIQSFRAANDVLMTHVAKLQDRAASSDPQALFEDSNLQSTKSSILEAHGAAMKCATELNALYKQAVLEFTTLQHMLSMDASLHLEAGGHADVAQAIAEATTDVSEALTNSRLRTKTLVKGVAERTFEISTSDAPRIDEWVKGAVEDSVPYSSTLKNGLRTLFGLDLDAFLWEPIADSARLATWIKVNNAMSFEVEMIAHFGSEALGLVQIVETAKSKFIAAYKTVRPSDA